MTILYQGSEKETINDIQNGTGSVNDNSRHDAAYSNTGAEIANTGYIEIKAPSSGMTSFYSSAYHQFGSGGNTNPGTSDTLVWCDSGGTPRLRFRMPTTSGIYEISRWNGSSWTVMATSANLGAFSGTWHAEITGIGGASGVMTVHRDGTLIATATGQDFTGFADIQFVRFSAMGQSSTRTGWTEYQIADSNIVLHRCKTVVATSGGTDNTDGSGLYTAIDESTQVGSTADTDYIELTTNGHKRSFKGAARTLSQPAFKGVTVPGRLMRVDGTGPQQARPYLLISGTRYYGTTFALTTGFANYQYTWNINPATTLPWTAADVNSANLEWGWEAVT